MSWGHAFYSYQVMNWASLTAYFLAQIFLGKFQKQT